MIKKICNGTKVTINGADDVSDMEIQYWKYFIYKYIDFNLERIVRLYVDVDDNDEVTLKYTGTSNGEATLKRRKE